MHTLIEQLLQDKPVITDGSWGVQIQRRGLARGECPDSWNLEKPELVEDVARQYVVAGSQVILTNTFGANAFVLGRYGLDKKVEEINRAGVEISKKAAGDRAKVFASIGPTGKMLVTGEVTESGLKEAFALQAKAIAAGGADAIVVETMMDITEARLAIEAALETGLPVVGCMVFDAGKEKDRTMMGNTPEEMAEEFTKLGVAAVGTNCGQGIEGFIPLCRRIKEATGLPIWIKPNAGLPETVDGEVVYTTTPEEFGEYVPAIAEAGASFIGGCCGTDETFVREIRRRLGK